MGTVLSSLQLNRLNKGITTATSAASLFSSEHNVIVLGTANLQPPP